ncbi:MAG: hypothetical protein KatS3mg082_2799 [Nitrospiraceae bacterium]|nr:MAG: hypothetical protein KatS3mg082_2799 [Nitrospiraceae bacterium]
MPRWLARKTGEPEAWAEKLRDCKTAEEIRTLLSPQHSALSTDPAWARINYTVWSDVFVCPECTQEVVFWEAAVDKEAGKVHDAFPCPHCGASLTKRNMDRAWVTKYDKRHRQDHPPGQASAGAHQLQRRQEVAMRRPLTPLIWR